MSTTWTLLVGIGSPRPVPVTVTGFATSAQAERHVLDHFILRIENWKELHGKSISVSSRKSDRLPDVEPSLDLEESVRDYVACVRRGTGAQALRASGKGERDAYVAVSRHGFFCAFGREQPAGFLRTAYRPHPTPASPGTRGEDFVRRAMVKLHDSLERP